MGKEQCAHALGLWMSPDELVEQIKAGWQFWKILFWTVLLWVVWCPLEKMQFCVKTVLFLIKRSKWELIFCPLVIVSLCAALLWSELGFCGGLFISRSASGCWLWIRDFKSGLQKTRTIFLHATKPLKGKLKAILCKIPIFLCFS